VAPLKTFDFLGLFYRAVNSGDRSNSACVPAASGAWQQVQSDIRASGRHRFGRALLFKRKITAKDANSLLHACGRCDGGNRKPGRRPPETGAIVLFIALLFLFFGPVPRLFGARAFSFAISMAFAVFGAHRRPVNRLYFSGRIRTTECNCRHRPTAHSLPGFLPQVLEEPIFHQIDPSTAIVAHARSFRSAGM
jgi:hypothetical protein